MGEIIFKGARIYFNSLVENAEEYLSPELKPVEARIVEASFKTLGGDLSDDLSSMTGIWNYCKNGVNPNLGELEKKHINELYSKIYLNLYIREELSKNFVNIDMHDRKDISTLLGENEAKELRILEERVKNKNKDKYLKKLSKEELEKEIEEAKEVIAKKKDSLIPLQGARIKIYRQAINGHEVIGFSKIYTPLNMSELLSEYIIPQT